MPVYKRKYRSGKVAWYYQFARPGSTRQNQKLVTEYTSQKGPATFASVAKSRRVSFSAVSHKS